MLHHAQQLAREPDFRVLFETTPTPYLVLSPDLIIVAVNDAYLRVTLTARESLLGCHVFEAFPDNPAYPEGQGPKNLYASLQRVLRNRVSDTLEIQRYDIPLEREGKKVFEEHYWSPINTPVFNGKGELTHILHRVEDVTALMKAQDQLPPTPALASQMLELRIANQRMRESQLGAETEHRRLIAVLEAVPLGIFVADAKGALIHSNFANTMLWGENHPLARELADYAAWRGWWADGSERQGQVLKVEDWPLVRALRGELVPQEIIEVATFADPDLHRIMLTSAAPIKDKDGRLEGAVVAMMDISERMRTEQALRDADKRKDEFLAMLANELRNPLAPIAAAADLLRHRALTAGKVKTTSDIIARQVRHMAGLVDDLLEVSRVTRGIVQLERERLDAKRIVADAIEQVRPIMEARGHRITVSTPPESALVVGDRKRLVQVLANLLNNAAKYTPAGGDIHLGLSVEGSHVKMAVTDNGVGMRPDFIERAFDMFTQAERSSDRTQGGLGIGLALVKSLVELHGGRVLAFSEGVGKGSRFVVCLPHHADAQVVDAALSELPLAGQGSKMLKVMIVDDNVDAAHMLALLVELLGYEVFVEHSARTAIKRAQRERPDVCLLDVGLPDIDGHELARRLRGHESTRDAVLVAVTGYGQEQDRRAAMEAGFDHHFVKPVDSERLSALLGEIDR